MANKLLLALTATIIFAMPTYAKKKPYHDDQKGQQWKSMENGPWGFTPGMYYYVVHNKYSGGYLKWNFIIPSVKFDENKSGQKRIMPARLANEEIQRQKVKKVEEERQKIEDLYKEELVRQTDRSVDLMYSQYKGDFLKMQDVITEGLTYCLNKSKGDLEEAVREITSRNEILCSNIEYIHKTGIGYELENAKRQKAYEEAKAEMTGLVRTTAHLVLIADTHY